MSLISRVAVQDQKFVGDARRSDLLDTALSIFSEKGYEGATLQDIADRTGIHKGSIYYYYRSKEDILFDVLTIVHREHIENVKMLAAPPGSPVARLLRLLNGHVLYICNNLDSVTVFLREMERLPAERRSLILGADYSYWRVFRNLIAEAVLAGEIAPEVNAKSAALWILGSLNWLHRWYRTNRTAGPELVAARFADQLIHGLTASPLWRKWSSPATRSKAPKILATNPATARFRLPREERHSEILKAATRLFYVKSFETTSLQDIADTLGVKKAALYYYFSSKEDLLHALLTSIIKSSVSSARDILDRGGDPLSRLWRLVVAHVHHLCENLPEMTVFLHERKMIVPERRREILADDYAYQLLLVETLMAGQAAGQIRASIDPKLAALSILGSVNWVYTWFRPDGRAGADYVAIHFAAMTINSLATSKTLRSWRPPGLEVGLTTTR